MATTTVSMPWKAGGSLLPDDWMLIGLVTLNCLNALESGRVIVT